MNRLILVLLSLAVPGLAFAQVDIDGNKLTTEVRLGSDDYGDSRGRSSSVGYLSVTRRLNDNFAIGGIANGGLYFGSGFSGGGGTLSWNPTATSYVQVSGLRNSVTPTTQVWTASVEAGALLHKGDGVFKAVEAGYTQTWKGYDVTLQTSVAVYTPRVTLYLPGACDVTLRAGAVDLIESGVHNVAPSGGARMHVVVARHLEVTASAGLDSEGKAAVAQTLGLSARSYGGGVRIWLNDTTSVEAFAAESNYTISRLTGTTYGVHLLKRF